MHSFEIGQHLGGNRKVGPARLLLELRDTQSSAFHGPGFEHDYPLKSRQEGQRAARALPDFP